MRILHTSDWHVGRTIRGRSREEEHIAVLKEISGIVRREAVDLVIVAGDIFDTVAPSAQAEEIVYRGLLDLIETGAHVVLVSGNHDNPRRWHAVKPLLELSERMHTCAELARPEDGGCIDIRTRSGETARVALLPFLSQRGIVRADDLMHLDADKHQGKYAERCQQIIAALCASFGSETVNILVSHLTVFGASPGGGERTSQTIFDYALPAQVLPTNANYVALGHLHRYQSVPSMGQAWYSGSPLQLDFGETEDEKCVLLIDTRPGIPAEVQPIPLAAGRRLRTVSGPLDDLPALIEAAGDAYLRILVEGPATAGLNEAVRELSPNVVDVFRAPTEHQVVHGPSEEPGANSASERDLFKEYLDEHDADDADVRALFDALLEKLYASHAS